MSTAPALLEFWFDVTQNQDAVYRDLWFQPDDNFRAAARRFADDYERAARGELNAWQQSASGALALILLLDQFPNLFYPQTARL